MNDSPNYYAILPASVRYHPDLNQGEKLLYAEITALCNKTGECWATNKYFAELYNTSERTIKRYLQSLIKCGLVLSSVNKTDGNVRVLSLPRDKNVTTPRDKIVTQNNIRENNSYTGYTGCSISSNNLTQPNNPSLPLASPSKDSIVSEAVERFQEAWNSKLCNYCPKIAKITVFNEARRSKIKARLAEVAKLMKSQGIEKDLLTYFLRDIVYDRYMNSQFLRGEVPGRNGTDSFKMSIDHVMRPDFFAKMVEYRYDDRDEYRR